MSKLTKNLKWFLSELAVAEPEQYESGTLEIVCENEAGAEGICDVDIEDLAVASKTRIEELERALSNVASIAKKVSTPSSGVLGDIAKLAEDTLSVGGNISTNSAVMALREAIQEAEEATGLLVRDEKGTALTGAVIRGRSIVLTED